MKDSLFIQFMNERIAPRHSAICLANGFSDTWKFCKTKGDFYWATGPKHIEFGTMDKPPIAEDLPISSGNVYVSCFNVFNIYLVYQWALRYPDLKIVAGGPVTGSIIYNPKDIPENLHITDQTVEEYFNIPNLSQEWGLELPSSIKPTERIMFSYATSNSCYNKSCVFCSHDVTNKKRIKKHMGFEFNGLFQNYKIIFLSAPSITPKFLLEELPKFPLSDDYKFLIYTRPDKEINKVLPEVLERRKINGNKPDLTLIMGIDFLSNRMLSYIRKNHTLEDAATSLKIASDYDVDCCITSILGWPNVVEEDVKEAEEFLSIPEVQNKQWLLNRLQARANTYIHDVEKDLFKGVPHYIGPFYIGFSPIISDEKEELNEQIRLLFHKYIPETMLVDRKMKATNQYYNY